MTGPVISAFPAILLLPLIIWSPTRADSPALLDARSLSSRIDAHVAARQAQNHVQPAPLAEDAEFFRRLCLDLIGRIPTVAELRDFLDDTRPDKRQRWTNDLLDGPDHADLHAQHFANHLRRVLLSRSGGNAGLFVAPQLEAWLRRQLKANTPYDKLVRDLLTNRDAAAFYRAHENKPENLAGSTARLFLGVKLECAQCHDDRSGGSWKRKQFWEMAAFFNGLRVEGIRSSATYVLDPPEPAAGPARIQIPDTNTWVDGRFLDGSQPAAKSDGTPLTQLAAWLTRADNPWFARAAVNRTWHYFFGVGLIDPVDGLGTDDSVASHPELLDELTRQFVAHGFDLKYLVRAIAGSQAYQRTSRLTHDSQKEPHHFARAVVRGLSPEQVYQSFLTATGYRPAPTARPTGPGAFYNPPTAQGQFLAKIQDPHEQPTEVQTSIQQALFLLNSQLVGDATSLEKSSVLAAVTAGSTRSTSLRVEELYLAALSRLPRAEETERLARYAEEGGPARDRATALRDVFWAMLNSSEFVLNH